jgi:hypothetical protein
MSTLRTLPKADWQSFFDVVSKTLLGTRAEVEVAGLDVGDQIIAEWVPVLGVTYEAKDDLLDIALDSGSHLIQRPREIAVQEAGTDLETLTVTDANGMTHIVRFKAPLRLPTPAAR